jgi:hypothetical protein
VNGPVNTGLAFVNPSVFPVIISFFLTNQSGADFNHRTFTLGANGRWR